jgi:hypothetical protein
MIRSTGILLALVLAGGSLLPGCASDEPRSAPSGAVGAVVSSSGGVASDTSAEPVSTRTPSPASQGADETGGRQPEPSGGSTASAPNPRTPGPSPRARVIEAGAAEGRPAGGSEARFEADGATWIPGVGFVPRYHLKSIERRDDPTPDEAVMRHVPGTKIELPAPATEKPVEPGEADVPAPSPLLVPKEAK